MIGTHLAKFVKAAVCADLTRPTITRPFVATVSGAKWLCGTDGCRLHAVLLPEDLPDGYVLLDSSGDIAPLTRKGVSPPPVQQVWPPVRMGEMVATDRLEVVGGASGGLAVVFGNNVREPRVFTPWMAAAATDVVVNPKYVAEALLATGRGKRSETSVLVSRGSEVDAVVIEQAAANPEWRALVVPVQWERTGKAAA